MTESNCTSQHASVPLPSYPAPDTIPQFCQLHYNADPQTINQYLHCYTYIWLKNGDAFWMYPTNYDKGIVSGYVWDGLKWEYREIKRNDIVSIF